MTTHCEQRVGDFLPPQFDARCEGIRGRASHSPLLMLAVGILFSFPPQTYCQSPRVLTETSDPQHLAVIGGGYLQAVDAGIKSGTGSILVS
jgi:hypothetical protein